MTKIALLALDLDGSLLNSEKNISDKNKAALKKAQEMGVRIVLTTGRPLKAIQPFLEELGLANQADQYSITFNGGLIQSNDGTILDQSLLSYGQVQAIYDVTESLSLPLDAIQGETVYQIESDQASIYQSINPSLNFVGLDFMDLSSQYGYNKCVSAYEPAILDAALKKVPEEFFEEFAIFKSRVELLEWCPKDAHKAAGLEKLCRHLDIDKSQVMTLGDEANDLTMTQWAGIGAVVENAIPELKEVADLLIPRTNDQDALAWLIENRL